MKFLTIFPRLKQEHLPKDVGGIPKHLCEMLHGEANILSYILPDEDYSCYEKAGITVVPLSKITGFATLDVTAHILRNFNTYSVIQVFHVCRFSALVAFVCKLWGRLFSVRSPIIMLKMDTNGQEYRAFYQKPRWIHRVLRLAVDIATVESVAAIENLNQRNVFRQIFWLPTGYEEPSGFDKYSANGKENLLLHLARFGTYQKNSEEFLSLMPRFLRAHPKWRVQVFGSVEPPFLPVIERFRIEFRDIADRIEFKGFRPREEVEYALSTAKIILLTSFWEGYPAALAEARRWGIQAVTTNVNCSDEILNGCSSAFFYNVGDIEACLNHLKSAVDNENYFSSGKYLIERADYAAKFRWKRLLEPLATYLKTLEGEGES